MCVNQDMKKLTDVVLSLKQWKKLLRDIYGR